MKKISSGKVRDMYEVDDKSMMIVVSDRISAWDHVMPEPLKDKGKILNQLSKFWFDHTEDIIQNHVITVDFDEFPEEFKKEEFRNRSMLVKKVKMLPVECIVRGYISGSAWKEYKEKGTIVGESYPSGIEFSSKFANPIFTSSTKGEDGEHDINISFEEACNILGERLAKEIREVSIKLYNKCADYALTKGIIIADTKFEFGQNEKGELVLADEIFTPDSSRFWPVEKYKVGEEQESYDKQFLRNWLKENNFVDKAPHSVPNDVMIKTRDKYIEAYEKLTGNDFSEIEK